jgi:hypothetical protein
MCILLSLQTHKYIHTHILRYIQTLTQIPESFHDHPSRNRRHLRRVRRGNQQVHGACSDCHRSLHSAQRHQRGVHLGHRAAFTLKHQEDHAVQACLLPSGLVSASTHGTYLRSQHTRYRRTYERTYKRLHTVRTYERTYKRLHTVRTYERTYRRLYLCCMQTSMLIASSLVR